jgi:hypothetical protein
MMKKTFITLVTTSLYTASSYAFFCPTNFNQINIGDSIQTVEQQCGAPAKTEKADAPDNQPQEWNYYLQQPMNVNTMPQAEQAMGSIKTSFAFDGEGKLINITVNGVGVAGTTACGSKISLGDSRKSVESSCGKPSIISKQSSTGTPNVVEKQIENTYSSSPPVTLIFRDGKLAEIKGK